MTDRLAPTLDREGLRKIFADVLDVDAAEVGDSAHFVDDLGVDSLMALEILVNLERTYGVRLGDSAITAIRTLDSTYDLLVAEMAAAGRSLP
jgi:acyl carrier protein